MEVRQEIPCPTNDRESCRYYPNCELSTHHIRPRRLARLATEAGRTEEYQKKLRKYINHPLNKVVVCRRVHDFLDTLTTEELPSDEQIDRRLNETEVTSQPGT